MPCASSLVVVAVVFFLVTATTVETAAPQPTPNMVDVHFFVTAWTEKEWSDHTHFGAKEVPCAIDIHPAILREDPSWVANYVETQASTPQANVSVDRTIVVLCTDPE